MSTIQMIPFDSFAAIKFEGAVECTFGQFDDGRWYIWHPPIAGKFGRGCYIAKAETWALCLEAAYAGQEHPLGGENISRYIAAECI